jgi:hypothetical protein
MNDGPAVFRDVTLDPYGVVFQKIAVLTCNILFRIFNIHQLKGCKESCHVASPDTIIWEYFFCKNYVLVLLNYQNRSQRGG